MRKLGLIALILAAILTAAGDSLFRKPQEARPIPSLAFLLPNFPRNWASSSSSIIVREER
jgi:hypothetical protein